MPRHRNQDWILPNDGLSWQMAEVAVLMDIRDELQALNNLLRCRNFTNIPLTLAAIKRNTAKPKRKKAKP